MNKNVVSTAWLAERIDEPNLIILDATLPSKIPEQLNGKCIQNAQYFDLKNKFSDTEAIFPNTFPSVEKFEKGCSNLGIKKNSIIVVYDVDGIYASPRVWWMFKTIGFEEIYVLNGGLRKWISDGYKVVDNYKTPSTNNNFKIDFRKIEAFRSYSFIKENLSSQTIITIDARSKGRYNATEEEPRKELKSGCIPNSINIPYTDVLENGSFKSEAELKFIFQKIIKMKPHELVFSCGSGVTACIILLASEDIITCKKSVYDGSWTEWATLERLLN
ncbi:sulfurtransferase [Joostella sp. CR20]|uniref:sulfurtransferase n=1 Tax=Joostella sp. CR20 TaxID=2804312 RepID=UPI00313F0060